MILQAMPFLADQNNGLVVMDVSVPANPVLAGEFKTGGDIYSIVVHNNHAYVVDSFHSLWYLNITNPSMPAEVGSSGRIGAGEDIVMQGKYLYFAYGGGLQIFDTTNPVQLLPIANLNKISKVYQITLFDHYALLAQHGDGLRIMDISTPHSPIEVCRYDTPGSTFDLVGKDHFLFVADYNNGLIVLDMADLAQPAKIDSFRAGSSILSLAQKENYLLLGTANDGVRVLDITDPANVKEVSSVQTAGYPREMVVQDTLLYIASYYGSLEVITIKDPLNPKKLGYYRTGGYGYGLDVQDGIAWLADWYDGIYAIRFDAGEPTWVSEKQGQCPAGFSLCQNYPNPFNAATLIEYALVQQSDVTLVIYDLLGQAVKTSRMTRQAAGRHQWKWDGTDNQGRIRSSGIFFCHIRAGEFSQVIKMMMVK